MNGKFLGQLWKKMIYALTGNRKERLTEVILGILKDLRQWTNNTLSHPPAHLRVAQINVAQLDITQQTVRLTSIWDSLSRGLNLPTSTTGVPSACATAVEGNRDFLSPLISRKVVR